jgi:hypothetical protein
LEATLTPAEALIQSLAFSFGFLLLFSPRFGQNNFMYSPSLAQRLRELFFWRILFSMLTDEQTSPEQFAIYRRMTPERRLALAEQLCWTARKIKAAGLRSQHPDWSESRVNDEVRRIFTKHEPES